MIIEHVAKKEFKYGDTIIEKGEVFEPKGGKWDKKILDPENGLVFIREVQEIVCPDCGREFDKPQGLAGHKRHCKGK